MNSRAAQILRMPSLRMDMSETTTPRMVLDFFDEFESGRERSVETADFVRRHEELVWIG